MFGFGKDRRLAKLDRLLLLCGQGDDEVQADMLRRLQAAAREFSSAVPGISTFAELKLALRPDQADRMAEKSAALQKTMQSHPMGTTADEMVFFFIEASLRHKAGHPWPNAKQVDFIDRMIALAESTSFE